jgi:hypothetical protein
MSSAHPSRRRLEAWAAALSAALARMASEDEVLEPLLRDFDGSHLVSGTFLAPLLAFDGNAGALEERLSRLRQAPPRRGVQPGTGEPARIVRETDRSAPRRRRAPKPELLAKRARIAALLRPYAAEGEGEPPTSSAAEPAQMQVTNESSAAASRTSVFGTANSRHTGVSPRAAAQGNGAEAGRSGDSTGEAGSRRPRDPLRPRRPSEGARPFRRDGTPAAPHSPLRIGRRDFGGERASTLDPSRASKWLASRVARAGAGAEQPVLRTASTDQVRELLARAATSGPPPAPSVRPDRTASATPPIPPALPTVNASAGQDLMPASVPATVRIAEVLDRLQTRSSRRRSRRGDPADSDNSLTGSVSTVLSSAGLTSAALPSAARPPVLAAPAVRRGLRALAAHGLAASPPYPSRESSREIEPLAEQAAGELSHRPGAPIATDLFHEDFALRLERLLRREARRHGIEVDEP